MPQELEEFFETYSDDLLYLVEGRRALLTQSTPVSSYATLHSHGCSQSSRWPV
jgi:hypothetical protein